MKLPEILEKINRIMKGHENEEIFSVIIFCHSNDDFKLEKNDNRWNIKNEYKKGIVK